MEVESGILEYGHRIYLGICLMLQCLFLYPFKTVINQVRKQKNRILTI